MADFTFNEGVRGYDGEARAAEWINWAGALLSLALILGLAVWGWQLMQRDVSGVPVVRALEGPMRVAPADPGGRLAEHQGLSVNRIAAVGTAEPPVETIVLAPAPLSLTEEDAAQGALVAAPAPAPVAPEEGAPVLTATPANATDMAVAEALASIEAGELEPERIAPVAPLAGLSRSPLPRPRPVLEVTNVSPLSSGGADPVAGARVVQLGAFENAELAEAAWVATEEKFGDYMVGRTKVIQEAETGGRRFFRLRAAGFQDLADARRFCSVLVAGALNCIPVVQQ